MLLIKYTTSTYQYNQSRHALMYVLYIQSDLTHKSIRGNE